MFYVQGVSIKSSPPKTLGVFSLRLSFFAWNFASSYAHTSINFCRFILIFHQMAFFYEYPSFSPCQVLSIHLENENAVYQLFGNGVIFSSSRVLVSDNCKQSITDFCRAMLASSAACAVIRCPFVCLSVCLSVSLSRSYILSKRVNISSDFFHRRVDPSF